MINVSPLSFIQNDRFRQFVKLKFTAKPASNLAHIVNCQEMKDASSQCKDMENAVESLVFSQRSEKTADRIGNRSGQKNHPVKLKVSGFEEENSHSPTDHNIGKRSKIPETRPENAIKNDKRRKYSPENRNRNYEICLKICKNQRTACAAYQNVHCTVVKY